MFLYLPFYLIDFRYASYSRSVSPRSPYRNGRSASRSLSRSKSRSRFLYSLLVVWKHWIYTRPKIYKFLVLLLRRSRDSSDAENPGNNLYVTGLSSRITEDELQKHFESEGKVWQVPLPLLNFGIIEYRSCARQIGILFTCYVEVYAWSYYIS